MPRVYKQLLREEKLWVALMEDKDGEAITGRVSRYKALATELLSAVLTPSSSSSSNSCPSCGGTAAVSMASASNSIHVTVAVSGLVSKGADVETFVVRLETLETGTHPSRVIEELVTVQKPQEVKQKKNKKKNKTKCQTFTRQCVWFCFWGAGQVPNIFINDVIAQLRKKKKFFFFC